MRRLIIFCLVFSFIFLIACGSPEISNPKPVMAIASFEGNGDCITDQFFVEGKNGSWDFSVTWQCTPEYADAFGLYVHLITTANPVLASTNFGADEGTLDVHYFEAVPSGEAPFVIEVIAAQNCYWTIEIWQ